MFDPSPTQAIAIPLSPFLDSRTGLQPSQAASTRHPICTADHLLPTRAHRLSLTTSNPSRRRVSSWNPGNEYSHASFGGGSASPGSGSPARPRGPRISTRGGTDQSLFRIAYGVEADANEAGYNGDPWTKAFSRPSPASRPSEEIAPILESIIADRTIEGPFSSRHIYTTSYPSSARSEWRPSALLRDLRDSVLEHQGSGDEEPEWSLLSMMTEEGVIRLSLKEVDDAIKVDQGVELLLSICHPIRPIVLSQSTTFPAGSTVPESSEHVESLTFPTVLAETDEDRAQRRALEDLANWAKVFLSEGRKWDQIANWLEAHLAERKDGQNGNIPTGNHGKIPSSDSGTSSEDPASAFRVSEQARDDTFRHHGFPTFLDDRETDSSGAAVLPLPDLATLLVLSTILSSINLFRLLLARPIAGYAFIDALSAFERIGGECEKGLGDVEDSIAHGMEDGTEAMMNGDGEALAGILGGRRKVITRQVGTLKAAIAGLVEIVRIMRDLTETEYLDSAYHLPAHQVLQLHERLEQEARLYIASDGQIGSSQVDKMGGALESMSILLKRQLRICEIQEEIASTFADDILPTGQAQLAILVDELSIPWETSLFEEPFTAVTWDSDVGCGFVQAEEAFVKASTSLEEERQAAIASLNGIMSTFAITALLPPSDKTPLGQRGMLVTLDSPRSVLSDSMGEKPNNRDSMFSNASTDPEMSFPSLALTPWGKHTEGLQPRHVAQPTCLDDTQKAMSNSAEKMVHSGLDRAIRRTAAATAKHGLPSVSIKPIALPLVHNDSVSALYRFTCGGKSDQRMCRILGGSDTVMVRTGGGYEELVKWINRHFENEMIRAGMTPLPMNTPPSQIIGHDRTPSSGPKSVMGSGMLMTPTGSSMSNGDQGKNVARQVISSKADSSSPGVIGTVPIGPSGSQTGMFSFTVQAGGNIGVDEMTRPRTSSDLGSTGTRGIIRTSNLHGSPTSASTSYFPSSHQVSTQRQTPFPRTVSATGSRSTPLDPVADGPPRTTSPVTILRSASESTTLFVRQTVQSGSLGASSGPRYKNGIPPGSSGRRSPAPGFDFGLEASAGRGSRGSISIEGSPMSRSASISGTSPVLAGRTESLKRNQHRPAGQVQRQPSGFSATGLESPSIPEDGPCPTGAMAEDGSSIEGRERLEGSVSGEASGMRGGITRMPGEQTG